VHYTTCSATATISQFKRRQQPGLGRTNKFKPDHGFVVSARQLDAVRAALSNGHFLRVGDHHSCITGDCGTLLLGRLAGHVGSACFAQICIVQPVFRCLGR
jgi:hypothetical protein